MSEQIILPVPMDAEQIERLDLSANLIDLSRNYPLPRYLLTMNGVGFSPLGGIQAVTGQKKNGKTFLMCQLMAAILNAGCDDQRSELGNLRADASTMQQLGSAPTVLYCDTEQEIEFTAMVARRVHWLCRWPLSENNERFHTVWLRAEEDCDARWAKVKQAIIDYKPTAVFLDGIRDLISDFNALDQVAPIIGEIMAIATKNNCCFWTVLHENPGSQKMRGHLGTELGNKATDVFECIKDKHNGTGVTFTVKQEAARGRDVDDWVFQITDAAGKLGVPCITGVSLPPEVREKLSWEDRLPELSKALREIIEPPKAAFNQTICDGLRKKFKVSKKQVYDLIDLATEKKIITWSTSAKKYVYNVAQGEAIENSLPFPPPQAASGTTPQSPNSIYS